MSFAAREENDKDKIIINVGGKRHETFLSTLHTIPDTRLAWLAENELKSSDRNNQNKTKEVFFDRHPEIFGLILNYYRTGQLHAPRDMCGPLFEEELIFWGIEEKDMEACCWPYYNQHRDAEKNLKEFVGPQFEDSEDEENDLFSSRNNGQSLNSRWEKIRILVWTTMDDAYSSRRSKVYAFVSLFMILASVTAMCLDTVKELQSYRNEIQKAEYGFCAWFTLELICRFVFCPSRLKLIKEAMTWVDIISLLPYYIGLSPGNKDTLQLLRAIRLVRVFRIFRFFTFTSGLQIIVQSLKASLRELLLLLIILIIPVILFSSFLYEFEKKDVNGKFSNIPVSFWWAIITMTTVGYGDYVPTTPVGKLIGSVCAICGVLIVALPVSVIGNNFSTFYEHAQARLSLPKKKRRLVMGDANRLGHLQGQSNSRANENTTASPHESLENGLLMDDKSAPSSRKYHRRSRGTIYGEGQVYIGRRPRRSVVVGNGIFTRPPESKPKIQPAMEVSSSTQSLTFINSVQESKDNLQKTENMVSNGTAKRSQKIRKYSSRSVSRCSPSKKLKALKTKSCIDLKRNSVQDLKLEPLKIKRPSSAKYFNNRISPKKNSPNVSNCACSLTGSNHLQSPSLGEIKLSIDVLKSPLDPVCNGTRKSASTNIIIANGHVSKESALDNLPV